VTVVEETIRYIDHLHQMLAKRLQADDIRKSRSTFILTVLTVVGKVTLYAASALQICLSVRPSVICKPDMLSRSYHKCKNNQWRYERRAKGGSCPGRNSPGAQNGVKKKNREIYRETQTAVLLSV